MSLYIKTQDIQYDFAVFGGIIVIKSMTGYGQSVKQFDDYRITVELKTVNNRYLDTNVRVYKHYSFVEELIREVVPSKISRGKLDVAILFDNIKKDDRVVTLNEAVARGYYDALKNMAQVFELKDDITVSRLANFPDVFTVEKKEQDKEKINADVLSVLNEALDDLTSSRVREGERLKKFFDESFDTMHNLVSEIEKRSPQTIEEFAERIKTKVKDYTEGAEIEESRLLAEVCLYTDKINITEEITRFRSHLKEMQNLMMSNIPVGRKLDFTVQELNREANTMGSKCNDYEIAHLVVELKGEIEKVREQVQNIE